MGRTRFTKEIVPMDLTLLCVHSCARQDATMLSLLTDKKRTHGYLHGRVDGHERDVYVELYSHMCYTNRIHTKETLFASAQWQNVCTVLPHPENELHITRFKEVKCGSKILVHLCTSLPDNNVLPTSFMVTLSVAQLSPKVSFGLKQQRYSTFSRSACRQKEEYLVEINAEREQGIDLHKRNALLLHDQAAHMVSLHTKHQMEMKALRARQREVAMVSTDMMDEFILTAKKKAFKREQILSTSTEQEEYLKSEMYTSACLATFAVKHAEWLLSPAEELKCLIFAEHIRQHHIQAEMSAWSKYSVVLPVQEFKDQKLMVWGGDSEVPRLETYGRIDAASWEDVTVPVKEVMCSNWNPACNVVCFSKTCDQT